MSCCEAVESGVGRVGELSFSLVIHVLVHCWVWVVAVHCLSFGDVEGGVHPSIRWFGEGCVVDK